MSTTYDELKTLEEGPKNTREEVTKKSDKSKFHVKLLLTLSLVLTIFVSFETESFSNFPLLILPIKLKSFNIICDFVIKLSNFISISLV